MMIFAKKIGTSGGGGGGMVIYTIYTHGREKRFMGVE